jgi:hypothetical protein
VKKLHVFVVAFFKNYRGLIPVLKRKGYKLFLADTPTI